MAQTVSSFAVPLAAALGGTGQISGAASPNATTTAIPYLSGALAFSDSQFLRVSNSQTDLRAGTTAQDLDVYLTYTSGTTQERLTINAKGDGALSTFGFGMYAGSAGGTARDVWIWGGTYPNGQLNKAGANLALVGGAGTGSGATGQILFGLAPAGSSGTTTNVHSQYASLQTDGLHLGSSSVTTGALVFENSTNTNKTTFSITTPTATRTVTVPDASTTLPVATQVLTFSGPTAARTYTLPDASVTLAGLATTQTLTGINTFSASRRDTVVTLTDAATVAVDASTGNVQYLSTASSRTIGTPTNPPAAGVSQAIHLYIKNTSGGAVTPTFTTGASNSWRFGTDITTAAAIAAGTTTHYVGVWHAADSKWDLVSEVKGF